MYKDQFGYYIPHSDEAKKEAIRKKQICELYFLSDEDFEEGDIVLEIERNRIVKVLKSDINEEGIWDLFVETPNKVQYYPVNVPKKILATTNNFFLEENKYLLISSKLIKLFIDNQDLFLEELKKEVFPNT